MAGRNLEEILHHFNFFFLNTRKICNSNAMVGYLKLAGLGLDVCESAGKAKSHPGVITQLSGKGVL